MKTTKTVKSKATKTAAQPSAITPARKKTVKVTAAQVPGVPTNAPRREITNDLIAARAYIIWEQKGRPSGGELENWLLAESQLKREQSFTA